MSIDAGLADRLRTVDADTKPPRRIIVLDFKSLKGFDQRRRSETVSRSTRHYGSAEIFLGALELSSLGEIRGQQQRPRNRLQSQTQFTEMDWAAVVPAEAAGRSLLYAGFREHTAAQLLRTVATPGSGFAADLTNQHREHLDVQRKPSTDLPGRTRRHCAG